MPNKMKFATTHKPIIRIRIYMVLGKWAGHEDIVPTTQKICTFWAKGPSDVECADALPDLIKDLRQEFKGEVTIKLLPEDLVDASINDLVDYVASLGS